jgi:hypothetical protein
MKFRSTSKNKSFYQGDAPMFPTRKKSVKKSKIKARHIAVLCVLTLSFGVASSFLMTKNTLSASGVYFSKTNLQHPAKTPRAEAKPEETPRSPQIPPQTEALRIKIVIGETRDVPVVFAAPVSPVVVVSPEIAAAESKNGNSLTITGLKVGETILIVSGGEKRLTFIVQVTGKSSAAERQNFVAAEKSEAEKTRFSGSYDVSFVRGFDENPSLVRQRVDFRRKLSEEKTLRVSGEMFKFFNRNDRETALAKAQNIGLDRLSVGIDAPDKTIDFLDSQIRLSTLSFNNYPMRGFHLVSNPESSPAANSSKGIEIFAGVARPRLSLYDNHEGFIAGAMMPVVKKQNFRARAGFIAVVPRGDRPLGRGGTILHFDGVYAPNENFSADAETAFANGEFSFRARTDLKFDKFGAFGEITRLDKKSPLNAIGAQPGGRRAEAFGFNWRPFSRLNASVNYYHAEIDRLTASGLADFERSHFIAAAGYRFGRNSGLKFRFLDQRIETAIAGSDKKFQVLTRAFTVGHDIRFNRNVANSFEARFNFSRETGAGSEMENGFTLIEQLRFSFGKNSATAFLNYTRDTPSLASLVLRNPRLLPPLLQAAFTENPAEFLQIYRDRLAFLLPGVELPLTRNLDAGVRFQTSVSRLTLTGETRYSSGEILARGQKNLFAAVGLNFRLDAANSFGVNGWHTFGAGGQTALTFSYTHRFGTDAGRGFQFTKLLGFDRGRIQGRVYYDLNGNGLDDANEPGVAGVTIQLDGNRTVKTDAAGRYEFSTDKGAHTIALLSTELGVRLRASSATQQRVTISARQTAAASFGVSDFGFISGRVFNDANQTGEMPPNPHGIKGVRIVLRSADMKSESILAEQTTDGSGTYRFANLRPGNYTLEIDPATLPPNFRFPAQTLHQIRVLPIRGFYLDIPVAAQRAVAGIVFIDEDGDGKFDPQKDKPVEGAQIAGGGSFAVSDRSGAYILRNLAAGQIKLLVRSPQGAESSPVLLELGVEPVTKRAVNLAARR